MGNAAYNIPGDTEMKFIKAGFVSSLALCACLLTGCTQPVPPSRVARQAVLKLLLHLPFLLRQRTQVNPV